MPVGELERFGPDRLRGAFEVEVSPEFAISRVVERLDGTIRVVESGATWCMLGDAERAEQTGRVELLERDGRTLVVVMLFAPPAYGGEISASVGVGLVVLGLTLWRSAPVAGLVCVMLGSAGVVMARRLTRRSLPRARATFATMAAEVQRALAEYRPGAGLGGYRAPAEPGRWPRDR